jgi:sec-independent protein translocase protein TatA
MRSLGKGIIEFKKGLRGIEDEFSDSPSSSSISRRSEERRYSSGSSEAPETSVPKFELPASSVPQMDYAPQTSQD